MCVHRVNQSAHPSIWDAVFDTTPSGIVRGRPAPCPTVDRCRRFSCRGFTPSLITASQLLKREQSRDEQGVNVVAMTVHGYRRFGEPYCLQPQSRSTCVLRNLLVGCETMWVTVRYQFSEEYAVSSSKWKYLYTIYCGSGGFESWNQIFVRIYCLYLQGRRIIT
jgi:hypothetical protein